MALTPFIRATQGLARTTFGAVSPSVKAFQATARAVINFPSEAVRVMQALTRSTAKANNQELRVTQAVVRSVISGRVYDPKVSAWTFSLDGHDFYVLRLGNEETLLYDHYAKQWYLWSSGDSDLWKAFTGQNWQGGLFWAGNGSSVLVGDDANGSVYFLDPTAYLDDDCVEGNDPRAFLREITGQIGTSSFDSLPCYGVQLIGSVGEMAESSLTSVTLYTSDDQGHTWDQHETLTVANGGYDTRVEWWSLGSFEAPGRLFKVQDDGALSRIDYLGMMDDPDAKND